jgi:integrase
MMPSLIAVRSRAESLAMRVVIDKFMLQTHIDHLAMFRSKDRVLQARSYLKSIFSEAVEQDFLLKDPVVQSHGPVTSLGKERTVLTWDQLRLVLANLTAKDRSLLTLEMTDALRPSELFALGWRSFDGGKLRITETAYKGKIRPRGKTVKSLGANQEASQSTSSITSFGIAHQ